MKLYLLDSNDAANFPAHRGITSELYGGGPELRLKQELVLGIGGWRLLRALGIQPEVCHLNEGHAAFAVLERARDFMEETGQPFEVALAVTRAGNLFTTHTAVAAGFDRFAPALIEQYLGRYAEEKLGISTRRPAGAGPPRPGRRVGAVQHGLSGDPRQRRGQRREPPARRGEPAHLPAAVSALAGGRSAGRARDQRRPHADLGLGRGRRAVDGGLREGPLAGDDGDPGAGHSRASPTPGSGNCAPTASKSLVEYARERLSRQLAAAGALARGGRRSEAALRSRHADAGLRAPLRDLQAAEPAAARSGAAAAPADQSRAPGAAHPRRQGASGGPGRAGPDPGVDRSSSAGPRCARM